MAVTEGLGGFISASAAAPATFDAAGYAALTWTEIEEVTDIPMFGPAHSVGTHIPLKTGITNKFHTELNFGSMDLPMALSAGATGQAILRTARTSKDEISFRVTRSNGSLEYISGKVFSFLTGIPIGAAVPATAMLEFTRPNIAVAAP